MTDPLRSEAAAAEAELSERDCDARVEELLLSGLDHYFSGQHELAINIWTRVLFIDRGHARARAYIERARSAVSERQREGEELTHAGTTALEKGDVEGARRLLTLALERGGATEETFALLDRLQRLEMARAHTGPSRRRIAAPAPGRRRPGAPAAPEDRWLRWVAVGALLGMAAAIAVMIWVGREVWLGPEASPDAMPPGRAAELVLPVPSPADVALSRARGLYEKGRLREALPALDPIGQGDPLRPQADELRATIQQQLLDSRHAVAFPTGAAGAPR